MPTEPPSDDRRPSRAFPIAASLVSFAIVFFAFAPRFFYWPGVALPSSGHNPPECNRAIDTLSQLDAPFAPIENRTNRVVNWRLLFPVVGHYLRLSPVAFLALPYLGVLLVLGWTARLVGRESGDRRSALLATALVGTGSWFFVSTGWLAYFDAWYLLGTLVVAFSRSAAATSLACLLTPWVDERFLLALPLCVAVRGAFFGGEGRGTGPRAAAEGLRFLALAALYCALRVAAMASAHDAGSTAHLEQHLTLGRDPGQVLDGLWSGLRALWIFVAAAVGLGLRRGGWARGVLLVLAIPATAAANVMVANDLSRSASALIPAALLGILLVLRRRPAPARWLLAGSLVFNLLTPARHVIAGWDAGIPIASLITEARNYVHPPPTAARLYLGRGAEASRRGDLGGALREFEAAIRIDPASPTARVRRAECLARLSRTAESEAGFDDALRLDPRDPDIYLRRGTLRGGRGDLRGAAADLRRALELSPPDAPYRAGLEEALGRAPSPGG